MLHPREASPTAHTPHGPCPKSISDTSMSQPLFDKESIYYVINCMACGASTFVLLVLTKGDDARPPGRRICNTVVVSSFSRSRRGTQIYCNNLSVSLQLSAPWPQATLQLALRSRQALQSFPHSYPTLQHGPNDTSGHATPRVRTSRRCPSTHCPGTSYGTRKACAFYAASWNSPVPTPLKRCRGTQRNRCPFRVSSRAVMCDRCLVLTTSA